MTADFIEHTTLPEGVDSRPWREETLTAMKAKGVMFVRLSYSPDEPNHLYIEGWVVEPKDQGPHPWEASASTPATKFVGDLRHPDLRAGAMTGYLRQALEGIEEGLAYMSAGINVAARDRFERLAADIRHTLKLIAEVDGT